MKFVVLGMKLRGTNQRKTDMERSRGNLGRCWLALGWLLGAFGWSRAALGRFGYALESSREGFDRCGGRPVHAAFTRQCVPGRGGNWPNPHTSNFTAKRPNQSPGQNQAARTRG